MPASLLLVQSGMRVDEALLAEAPHLHFILRPGSGLDEVDLYATRNHGVEVLSSPEGNQEAVADHAMGMLIGLTKNVLKSHQEACSGEWVREPNRGEELSDLCVGIIGYGHTGPAFDRRLAGFGAHSMVYDPYRKQAVLSNPNAQQVSLEAIQESCQVISFHVPLTSHTHHYLSHEFVEQMAGPFWLINTSRGTVVALDALLNGLETGKIKGAALDVLPEEPPGSAILEALRPWTRAGRLVLTPHIAGWSRRSAHALYQILLDKLDRKLAAYL